MNGLRLTSVTRCFGDHTVLHSMDLSVQRGEIVGFVGGNGAGKTTTMRLILGLLSPDEGEITWDGKPISSEDRRHIGYMPEERGLYPQMPVREQIIHFALLEGHNLAEARVIASDLIASLGLQGREKALIQDLSLGNQQRVQLAVSLVGNPSLLVLDEPFSGLDPTAVATMSALIREQAAKGVGILFSSHQLDLVERLCDRVCVLDRGQVKASGSIAELRSEGQSRWQLEFSCNAETFAAEVAMHEEFDVSVDASDQCSVTVSLDGPEQDIPAVLLTVAQRHGGLRSIQALHRSLDDLLAEQFISAGLPAASKSLATTQNIGGK